LDPSATYHRLTFHAGSRGQLSPNTAQDGDLTGCIQQQPAEWRRRRVTVGPSEAFALFFKHNSGPVFRALVAGTLNRAAAEDATAEAFARAFAHWDTVAVHPNPRAWVLRVAWPSSPGAIPTWSPRSAVFPQANERSSSSSPSANSLPPGPLASWASPPGRSAASCLKPVWPFTGHLMHPLTQRKTMTEELLGRGDPVIQRLQQAFADEEPATDLAAVMQRAARYLAGGASSCP
jgi:hypothetical protein